MTKSDKSWRSNGRCGTGGRAGSSFLGSDLRSVGRNSGGCQIVSESPAASPAVNPPAPPWSPTASIFASSSSLNHIRRHHICTSCRCSLPQVSSPGEQTSPAGQSGTALVNGAPSYQTTGHRSLSGADTSASTEAGSLGKPYFSRFSPPLANGTGGCRVEERGGCWSSVWTAFPKPTEPLVFMHDVRRGMELRETPTPVLQRSVGDSHGRPRTFFITLRSLKGTAKSCTATAARVVPEDAVRVSVE